MREKWGQSTDKKSIRGKYLEANEFPKCRGFTEVERSKFTLVAYDQTIKQDLTKNKIDNSRWRVCDNSHESFCYKQMLC